MLPEPVKLDPKDASALKELSEKQQGVMEFVQLVTQQGEQRISKLKAETADLWDNLRVKHNLDLEHVNYTLDNDGENIVPVTMRLV